MAVRDLIVLNTTQSRLEPHQGSDTVRLKGGSSELLRLADGNDVAVMTVRSLSPGLNISGSITGSSVSGSESSTGSFYYVDVDQMSGNADQIKDIVTADVVSSSAQLAAAISGSWQGEFSSSAKMFIGGGVSGSEESTGSFGRIQATTLIGDASQLTNVITVGTVSRSLATNLTSGSITHNQSLQFDGVNNYVTIADNSSLDLADTWTISAWIKLGSGMSGYHRIAGKQGSSACNYGIGIQNGTDFGVFSNDGAGWDDLYYSTDLNAGQWYYVAGQWDGSNMNIYIDGIQVGSDSKSGTISNPNNHPLLIGLNELGGTEYFEGNIDEVSIWSSSLSRDSVYALYNHGNPTDLRQPWGTTSASQDVQYTETSSLVGWWRMGDSHHWSGSTVDGASPSGYITASFEGSRWFIDNVMSSSYGTGSSVNMSANSASTDVPKNHSESGLDFNSQTISNDVTGSWQGVLSGSIGYQGIDSFTTLLVQPNGTNNDSGSFTDLSSNEHSMSVNGAYGLIDNTKETSSFAKFGSTSLFASGGMLGGSPGADVGPRYLSVDTSTTNPFEFGTDPWTVEGWYYFLSDPSGSGQDGMKGMWGAVSSSKDYIYAGLQGNGQTYFRVQSGGANIIYAAGGLKAEADQWNHLVWQRHSKATNDNGMKFFINGVSSSVTFHTALGAAENFPAMPGRFTIGSSQDSSQRDSANAYVDQFRVSKGIARYTHSMAQPSTAFKKTDSQQMRESVASIGGISGSGTQAGNLLVHSRLSGSGTSTGSFDKVHIDYLSGDGTLVTGIMPAGVISSSVRTNLTSSGIIQNINKNYSFSGSNDYGSSRYSPRFDIAHDNQQSNGIDSKNFTISYWDYPWGWVHNKNIIRKESAYTLEKYVSANTFHNRYEFRAGFGNTTFSLSGSYSGSYWHNIVFVREGSNAKLYMQGELACTVPVGTGTLDNDTNPITLMTSHNGNYPDNGAFGGYAMWDQGLSGSEVRSIYNHGEPTDLNHTWEDYSQTGSLILWLNPASSSFDSSDTNGVSLEGTWTIADSSVRNNMFATSSGMNESSRSDHHPIGHILGTQDPTFNSDISGSFTGFLSSSTAVTSSARFSGSFTSTGSFDALHTDFLEGDGSELTGIQPDGSISSSAQLSGISGSWRAILSGSDQLIMSSSFSGSAASTGSFDVLYGDILRGDASEVTGLHVPSGALSRSYQTTGEGSALSSLTSGSWADISSSLANRYVNSASGFLNQSVRSGSSVSFSEVNVTDTVFYRELIVSSSDSSYSSSFASGSTRYGDDSVDTHEVTGSINMQLPLQNQYSMKFDGSNDHMATANPISATDINTFAAWVKPLAGTGGDNLKLWVDITGGDWLWGFRQDKQVNYTYQDGDLNFSDSTLPLHEWSFVVMTRTTSSVHFYLDGELDGTGSVQTAGKVVTGDLGIGSRAGSTYQYTGLMSDLSLWRTALSGSEIKTLYNDGIPVDLNKPINSQGGSTTGSYTQTGSLVGWWRMGDSASLDGSTWSIVNSATTGSAAATYLTSSGMDINSRVPQSPTISSSLGAGDGKTFFTVRGNISGSAQSSGSFGSLFGSGDGLSGLVYSASRADQSVWKGQSDSFNIPTGSTAERAVITGSAPQYVSASGMMRFNSTDNNFEGWDGRNWITLAEGSANSDTTVVSGSMTISGSIPGQRGLFFGSNGGDVSINYLTISSFGDAIDFGDTETSGRTPSGAGSMENTGVILEPSSDDLSYVAISTPGNAADFGNLTEARQYGAAMLMNGTNNRLVIAGGDTNAVTMDFVNVRNKGDAIDFGDQTVQHNLQPGALTNGIRERGVIAQGAGAAPGFTATNVMEYITISTKGNGTDFGDGFNKNYWIGTMTNDQNDRGVIVHSTYEMSYITLTTPSNAIIFGEEGTSNGLSSGQSPHSNGTDERGILPGGHPSTQNVISYITISTTGNAQDFGGSTFPNMINNKNYEMGSLSNGAQ